MADPLEIFARQLIGGPTGWACPVCGKGNAPDAKVCGPCPGHTAAEAPAFTSVQTEAMPRKERDMDPGG